MIQCDLQCGPWARARAASTGCGIRIGRAARLSDGSTDATNDKLLSFRHPWMRPILVERNSGKGNAVRSGFQSASGDYVLFIDGGMEIHP